MDPHHSDPQVEETPEQDLQFESILSSRSAEKRTALIVFLVVLVLVAIVAFGGVSISRTSGLQTQLRMAQQQVQEANQVVDERDRQLRDAHAETAALATPGQGAGVLTATAAAKGASGVALDHPAQHALGVYAFNLMPPPADQEYRLVVTDGTGQESLLGTLTPDDRGAAFLLARDVPEGIAKVEVALIPKAALPTAGDRTAAGAAQGSGSAPAAGQQHAAAKAPTERKPMLVGALPGPGEAGVVAAAAGTDQPGAQRGDGARAHGRAAGSRR